MSKKFRNVMSRTDLTIPELIAKYKRKIVELQSKINTLEAFVKDASTEDEKDSNSSTIQVVEEVKPVAFDYATLFKGYSALENPTKNNKYLYIVTRLEEANADEFIAAYLYLHPEHDEKTADGVFRQGNQVFSNEGAVELVPDSRSTDKRKKITRYLGTERK